jgi:prepilin-type N-terminal cleavage/methylation domain-containing protein
MPSGAITVRRRSGVTLLEVLVAMFVMAIGLLALLTLFPLGALRMYKAIQDERCAEAGANARAMMVMKINLANDSGLYMGGVAFGAGDPFCNPNQPPAVVATATSAGPSYPVLIDPIAAMNGASANVGSTSVVSRRSVSFAGTGNFPGAYQWFMISDDIDFESAAPNTTGNSNPGTPRLLLPPPSSFTRSNKFSYAFLCQRPNVSDTSIVDTSVVVFNQRPVAAAPNEYVFSGANTWFNTSNNTVQIDISASAAPIRVGDWILDATPINSPPTTAHGYFYRVLGVSDLPNNLLELEIETPIRGFAPNTTTPGIVIFLDGVAEVYEKGPMRSP